MSDNIREPMPGGGWISGASVTGTRHPSWCHPGHCSAFGLDGRHESAPIKILAFPGGPPRLLARLCCLAGESTPHVELRLVGGTVTDLTLDQARRLADGLAELVHAAR